MTQCFYPQLIDIEALEPYCLRTYWNTNEILDVDVSAILKGIKALAPILQEDNFKKVHVCDHGQGVEWFDTEIGADNVYAWAMEQKGMPSHEMFHVWLYRNRLSYSEAAQILGISERLVELYANAREKIPLHVWLACVGYEVLTQGQKVEDVNDENFKTTMIERYLKMFPVR